MSFAEKSGRLVASVSFTELFDKEAYWALSSGVPSHVIIRTYVYEKRSKEPIGVQIVSLRVVYDLWDEMYLIRIQGPRGTKNFRLKSRVEVLRMMTSFKRLSVSALSDIKIGPHYVLAMVIELNPVNLETLAEMRRWLTKSTSEIHLNSSSNFFGSFVSVFVNPKLEKAERRLRLRSQPFFRVNR